MLYGSVWIIYVIRTWLVIKYTTTFRPRYGCPGTIIVVFLVLNTYTTSVLFLYFIPYVYSAYANILFHLSVVNKSTWRIVHQPAMQSGGNGSSPQVLSFSPFYLSRSSSFSATSCYIYVLTRKNSYKLNEE
jgi:hypothetical protein